MKAQMVKNTVIVPAGSKGGFVLKKAPPAAERDAYLAEGVACYQVFIGSLLSLTDNLVGGLVVRRPGAALLCEVVAALVSMIPGTQWGFTTLISGILQGLGAEFAFLLLGYSVYGLGAAIFAGAMAAPLEAVYGLSLIHI